MKGRRRHKKDTSVLPTGHILGLGHPYEASLAWYPESSRNGIWGGKYKIKRFAETH